MQEVSIPHTGLLRLGLATAHSLAFWTRATVDAPLGELCRMAEEQSWFGDSTPSRVKYLVAHLQKRFPYPARKLLEFRSRPEPRKNALVCHWHLQLADPVYRDYTGHFLLLCWARGGSLSLDETAAWLARRAPARHWRENTRRRMASGLMSAATEAGLLSRTSRMERELKLPPVDEDDLAYLGELLKLAGAQTKSSNPYLISVGLGSGRTS